MKALGKKVIVAIGKKGKAKLLRGISDYVFEFGDMREFKVKIRKFT